MKNLQILYSITLFLVIDGNETWTGNWFPANPNGKADSVIESDNWKGIWFPSSPAEIQKEFSSYEKDRIMGIPNIQCDDAENNLHIDFDPKNSDHFMRYMCLETTYTPNFGTEPMQIIHDVPKYYTPVHKCMNETITYEQNIPTIGYHRPLWAAYGEYDYLPLQRWLHNIEHGAIVALYHPCANRNEVAKLKSLVKGCLYRHIITPYENLTSERPFALLAWGTSLEFSVFDRTMATEFILKYAKNGREKTSKDGQYKHLLSEPAKLISDVDDSKICPIVTVM